MKFLFTNKNLFGKDFENLEQEYDVEKRLISSFSVLVEKSTSVKSTTDSIAFLDGYLREFSSRPQDVEKQIKTGIDFISGQWPVNDNITGSFSCAIINKVKDEVILCNDSIGIYPLYYSHNGGNFYVSNSIVWLGIVSTDKIDDVGLFQRTYCPEFANIGSRTLLKNIKRLLPGEWIKFNNAGDVLAQKFDNELYQNITKITSPYDYWERLKKELSYCVGGEENLHIALSGGMDSRLIIGGLPKEKELFCHTYGKDNFYETQIAKRIASLYDAEFRNYTRPELYFPTKEILEKYTVETEAIYLNSWLEVLESQEKKDREIMLLGDMTESLQGRNLPIKKNWKNFKEFYLGGKEYSFCETTREGFDQWKNSIIENYSRLVSQKHIDRVNIEGSEEQIRDGIINDLNEIFERIEQHNLPYLELVSEIFSWFTHARIPMGKQILILNSQFNSYCVPMSIQILRLTSNLHPNLRLSGRYIKAVFSSVKELKLAGGVPTSQIPYVAFNTPEIFKVPVWFLRSELDDFLIKRLMKSGNPGKRYRVLKSFNWVEVYQDPQLEQKLNSYFDKNYIGEEYSKGIIKGALARRDLKRWPLSNVNIINAAALNAELALLDLTRRQ